MLPGIVQLAVSPSHVAAPLAAGTSVTPTAHVASGTPSILQYITVLIPATGILEEVTVRDPAIVSLHASPTTARTLIEADEDDAHHSAAMHPGDVAQPVPSGGTQYDGEPLSPMVQAWQHSPNNSVAQLAPSGGTQDVAQLSQTTRPLAPASPTTRPPVPATVTSVATNSQTTRDETTALVAAYKISPEDSFAARVCTNRVCFGICVVFVAVPGVVLKFVQN